MDGQKVDSKKAKELKVKELKAKELKAVERKVDEFEPEELKVILKKIRADGIINTTSAIAAETALGLEVTPARFLNDAEKEAIALSIKVETDRLVEEARIRFLAALPCYMQQEREEGTVAFKEHPMADQLVAHLFECVKPNQLGRLNRAYPLIATMLWQPRG
jgi:hypothetical protein